jgi:hypothetical protein
LEAADLGLRLIRGDWEISIGAPGGGFAIVSIVQLPEDGFPDPDHAGHTVWAVAGLQAVLVNDVIHRAWVVSPVLASQIYVKSSSPSWRREWLCLSSTSTRPLLAPKSPSSPGHCIGRRSSSCGYTWWGSPPTDELVRGYPRDNRGGMRPAARTGVMMAKRSRRHDRRPVTAKTG